MSGTNFLVALHHRPGDTRGGGSEAHGMGEPRCGGERGGDPITSFNDWSLAAFVEKPEEAEARP